MNHSTSPVLLALTTSPENPTDHEIPVTPTILHAESVLTPDVPALRLHSPQQLATPPQEGCESSTGAAATTIVDGLLKAAHRLRGVLSHHFAEFDLSDVRYTVLRMLADSEPDGCTQADVAAHLDQSESSISMLIKRMRNSELLFRLRSLHDKRKWVLKLTNHGRELLQNVRDCHTRRMADLLREFSLAEQESFGAQLQKLLLILATSSLAESGTADKPVSPLAVAPTPRSDASPAA